MEDAAQERYVFLRFAEADASEALNLVLEAKTESRPLIQRTLLQVSVLAYMRPFRWANSRFRQSDGSRPYRIRLEKLAYVAEEHLELHEMLESYRDSAYAHTDLKVRHPTLRFWEGHRWEFPIAFKPVDRAPLNLRIPALQRLFSSLQSQIEDEIQACETSFKSQYGASALVDGLDP
ncbi:hypothetical protein [Luteimonas sp. 3794]|uniref:hypothetical protein n=1 Tax=Luteimonas sp. 3794 TaxID=2817730 RepID=UPI0028586700|nr:hypothetical protein [Luteimonas sp. 3794]MDR6992453.1 hypothetical protein [Luteimonas sp. 3794]